MGLEQFISVPKFVLQYAEFLIGLADIHNARALFERALGEVDVNESKPIWDRFLQVISLITVSPSLLLHHGHVDRPSSLQPGPTSRLDMEANDHLPGLRLSCI